MDFPLNIYAQLIFDLYYPSGYYTVVEQYYVYDIASFIADFGGYLVRNVKSNCY